MLITADQVLIVTVVGSWLDHVIILVCPSFLLLLLLLLLHTFLMLMLMLIKLLL